MSSPGQAPVASVVGDAAPIAAGAEVAPVKLPPGATVKLVSVRGLKLGVEYPIYEGSNYIGRSDENPVDIDLDDQEPQERSWISRQHCLLTLANDELVIEDLNSANGTYVGRQRVAPGQKRGLAPGDVIQLGTIHLKVTV
jgi:pSer/pThr/pTyr-binding forkhead associated (FHA) protein